MPYERRSWRRFSSRLEVSVAVVIVVGGSSK
jgi:hypothetical protein